jgi:hypothetical protein
MIANTQIKSKGPSSSGPHLRGHSINLEKVLVKSPIEGRHTKVKVERRWGGDMNRYGWLSFIKSYRSSIFLYILLMSFARTSFIYFICADKVDLLWSKVLPSVHLQSEVTNLTPSFFGFALAIRLYAPSALLVGLSRPLKV